MLPRLLPLLVLNLVLTFAGFSAEVRRPNILVVTIDNLGYADLGCFGNPLVLTPNLDALAREGVRCTSFYSASPTCSPSRAALLTGRYPQRNGLNVQLPGIAGNWGQGLAPREVLIPAYLKPAGYATGCFGKWNIGFAPGTRPTEEGFDEFIGFVPGQVDYYSYKYQGRHGLIGPIALMSAKKTNNIVEFLEDNLKDIEEMRYKVMDKNDTALQSIVDEIVALYLSTLYKLKFLA